MATPALAETAATIRSWLAEGRSVAVGRVVAISGFSTWPGDELLAVDATGKVAGAVLGAPGTAQLVGAMGDLLATGSASATVTVEIHGKAVVEAGLSCGGQADVLVQPAADLPGELWAAMADRRAVAMATPPTGPAVVVGATAPAPPPFGAGTAAVSTSVPVGSGRAGSGQSGSGQSGSGRVGSGRSGSGEAIGGPGVGSATGAGGVAAEALASGHSGVRRTEDGTLVEAWVPAPRLVVVGDGDLVAALDAQAGVLGWECRPAARPEDLDAGLAWAGGTAAVVVLSHDPHIDVPALRRGLESGAPYVGAMGSRRTQSRRFDRLTADGVDPGLLERIHRPIGLDLGGRSAPEVALAICAEILACRTGRDGGSLRDRTGPIHDRPRSV